MSAARRCCGTACLEASLSEALLKTRSPSAIQNAQEGTERRVQRALACLQGAPLVSVAEQHPVVLFSHGISGIRTSYSGICTELSSAVGPRLTGRLKRLGHHRKASACPSKQRAVSGCADARLARDMPPWL